MVAAVHPEDAWTEPSIPGEYIHVDDADRQATIALQIGALRGFCRGVLWSCPVGVVVGALGAWLLL